MKRESILKENDNRNKEINAPFDPLTGEGAILDRFTLYIPDFYIPKQHLPVQMKNVPLIKKLIKHKTIKDFIINEFGYYDEDNKLEVEKGLIKARVKHDFCFWAFFAAKIKNKKGGKNIPFKLNKPQIKLLKILERMRLEGKPIRIILLKARQWGGSTLIQLYIAWIQLVHKEGFYSAIIAQDSGTSRKIRAMYTKMLRDYPPFLLNGTDNSPLELKPYEGSHNDTIVTQKGKIIRDTVICIGTAERPDSIRGGDISESHMSEVAFWKATDGKTPEDIIRSISSSILLEELTLDAIESTPNGTGNFFHKEWLAAKNGESEREPVFVAWYEIPMYSKPFKTKEEKEAFADWIIDNRNSTYSTDRSEPGTYYWYLWNLGATLEAINWYIVKRKGYNSHADMAAEFPSDDIEAFKHSGKMVFDRVKLEELRKSTRKPQYIGDVIADGYEGRDALKNVRFTQDTQGCLSVYALPEEDIKNRYAVIVDVGGRSKGADFSDILVIDRYWMMEGDKPEVVAEWHGHIDHDLLAWKAAQIATLYHNALLVIESNTLETKDKERDTDGNHTEFILNQIGNVYENLYARKQSEEDIIAGVPRKYGFHTNTATKPMIIDHLIKMVRLQAWVERSSEAIDEFVVYEKKQNGSFGAIPGEHDDRLMTRAIGLFIVYCEMELPKRIEKINKPRASRPASAATI